MNSKPKHYHVEQQWALRESLPMWTVYRPTTSDLPGLWVARMHISLPTPQLTGLAIMGATLEEVRQQLPPGLTNIGRKPADDPVIEEVWL
jgi:hypothetical protein